MTGTALNYKFKQREASNYPGSFRSYKFRLLPAWPVVLLLRTGITGADGDSSENASGFRHFRTAPIQLLLALFHFALHATTTFLFTLLNVLPFSFPLSLRNIAHCRIPSCSLLAQPIPCIRIQQQRCPHCLDVFTRLLSPGKCGSHFPLRTKRHSSVPPLSPLPVFFSTRSTQECPLSDQNPYHSDQPALSHCTESAINVVSRASLLSFLSSGSLPNFFFLPDLELHLFCIFSAFFYYLHLRSMQSR